MADFNEIIGKRGKKRGIMTKKKNALLCEEKIGERIEKRRITSLKE